MPPQSNDLKVGLWKKVSIETTFDAKSMLKSRKTANENDVIYLGYLDILWLYADVYVMIVSVENWAIGC